jgi:sugar transferase (PEP-CTERM/EpsH1 system associated)
VLTSRPAKSELMETYTTSLHTAAINQEYSLSRPLRVLHVVSIVGMGGTENGVLKVMNGLGEERFEHGLCAVRAVDGNFARHAKLTSKTYSAGTSKAGFQFPLFRLARIMKQFRPDIVHTRNFGSLEGVPAARLAGVPVVIHSEHGYEVETLSGLPLRRRMISRMFYSLTDAVFTVTRDLRDYFAAQSWLEAGRFRVIYNGVDTERFVPCLDRGASVRQELGIPPFRFVIGSVGRVVPIKDHLTLLKSAENLVSLGLDIHVLIVGSGTELPRIKQYATESCSLRDRCTFTGASDRVPALLNAMDVFVLPSLSEGMSNTILEAMASGIPVVATRAGGNPEIVEENVTGWLFSPGNSHELTDYLRHLTRNLSDSKRMGAAARRHVGERFSLQSMLQNYRDLYVQCAQRRGVWKGD